MIELLENVMGHNFYPSLLVVSGVVLCFHYSSLAGGNCGCPVIVASGQPETGKTKSIKTALSMIGMSFDLYISILHGTNTCR